MANPSFLFVAGQTKFVKKYLIINYLNKDNVLLHLVLKVLLKYSKYLLPARLLSAPARYQYRPAGRRHALVITFFLPFRSLFLLFHIKVSGCYPSPILALSICQ
ncbi:hypothetical protein MON38_03500 [Hymenobacter sp. DH14]|uniref:Uncharacterized protein n=1 Tax=Hymenobacter cyanobacteriorum TaxID=2926463 RepID=A0A9X1VE70_9BACT|nr:hypothetical protein [Hymenobacter cyanobacteriorum]MCI1186468.1 hypothetical protein [Hymenobacter cyanobacteriorum]